MKRDSIQPYSSSAWGSKAVCEKLNFKRFRIDFKDEIRQKFWALGPPGGSLGSQGASTGEPGGSPGSLFGVSQVWVPGVPVLGGLGSPWALGSLGEPWAP